MIKRIIECAIDSNAAVWIQYRDQRGRLSQRHVYPTGFTRSARDGRLKMVGECEVLFENRSFFIYRIEQIAPENPANPEHLAV